MLDMQVLLADIGKNNCKFFSLIDLSSSYNQVPMTPRSQEIATMVTPFGSYSPKTCIFGLKNLPAQFQRLMSTIFEGINSKVMAFFQDDIIIYSSTFEQHIVHIEEVLTRLQAANLTAKPEKTFLCKKTITYLGFTLNKRGITTTQDNVDKIKNYPTPKTQREVRSFLGCSNFFRHLIKNYGIIAKPLYELTKKLKGKFQWNSEAESAFQELKTLLTTAPVLAYPDMNSEQPLILVCDTSPGGIGFLLSQKQRSDVSGKLVERPIFYGSTYLRDNQRKLGSSDLEITGIAFAIKKLDSWLRGHKFTLITDHKSSLYMINKNLDHFKPAMARKIMFLQQ